MASKRQCLFTGSGAFLCALCVLRERIAFRGVRPEKCFRHPDKTADLVERHLPPIGVRAGRKCQRQRGILSRRAQRAQSLTRQKTWFEGHFGFVAWRPSVSAFSLDQVPSSVLFVFSVRELPFEAFGPRSAFVILIGARRTSFRKLTARSLTLQRYGGRHRQVGMRVR